jgi:hypothetical protein
VIWAGCLLMAIGGLLALSDRRYRVGERGETRPPRAATAESGPGLIAMRLKLLAPLAVFVVICGFLLVGCGAIRARCRRR